MSETTLLTPERIREFSDECDIDFRTLEKHARDDGIIEMSEYPETYRVHGKMCEFGVYVRRLSNRLGDDR